jgi:glycosyltransferase involved in cell wall biosynthesis
MNVMEFPKLYVPEAALRPILAIDMTALWDRPASGIQRVICALAPDLAAEAARRGWDIQLVRHATRGLGVLGHWSTDTTLQSMHADLDAIAMGIRNGANVMYARVRNGLRRKLRAFRLACRSGHGDMTRDRWLRRHLPGWLQEGFAEWKRRCSAAEVVADAYITFSAGILPATVPVGVPPERCVYVIHDLIPLRFPHYYRPRMSRTFLANLGEIALSPSLADRRFITASRHVATDIRSIFRGIAQADVDVDIVTWGYDRATFFPQPDPSFRSTYGISEDATVVVAVSTQDPRKRFADIAAAVNASNTYAIFLGAGRARREGNAIFLGHVSDELVRRAYSSSDVFVNWSAAEGFGLPTIEALACGARVVVPPDNPTLLEIGGDHVTVADRADVPALCQAIRRAIRQPRQIPDLTDFSWQHPLRRFSELLLDEPARGGTQGVCDDGLDCHRRQRLAA